MSTDSSPSKLQPMLLTLIDQIDYPLLLVDAQQQVMYANSDGQRMLDGGAALRQINGRVQVRHEADRQSWAGALADCRRGMRRLVFLGPEPGPMSVAMSPLLSWPEAAGEHAVLIVFGRSLPCQELTLHGFAKSVGMTATEARVAAALLGGASAEGIAQEHCVCLSTVRTQIRSILEKTQSPSIRLLLLRLSSLPPLRPRPLVQRDAMVTSQQAGVFG